MALPVPIYYKYIFHKKLGLRIAHINYECLELYAGNMFYTIYWLWSNSDASLHLQTDV